jgi:DNA-binding transcriptional regulator YhcF (GntR family)
MSARDNKPMLGRLLGSNSRVKILKLFLLHPEKYYYIRQIARDLKLQLNSVQRELENLEKFGILTSHFNIIKEVDEATEMETPEANNKPVKKPVEAKQEKRYFKVDRDFILYEEIRSLIIKAQILYEKDFAVKIEKTGQPKLIILTGIFVNNPNSIIDIFVVGKFDRHKLLKVIKELEDELGREVNFTVMDTKEFKYRRDITDVFLYTILEGKKFVVIDELGI